ncbi:MAG: hypothetical protein M3Z66_17905 [Chloroflexota bacterium]|nr:hypothetical protein [Chloroflexota bacterium]
MIPASRKPCSEVQADDLAVLVEEHHVSIYHYVLALLGTPLPAAVADHVRAAFSPSSSPCLAPGRWLLLTGHQIASPARYVASGGKLLPLAVRQARTLPHLQYWEVQGSGIHSLDCRGAGVETDVEIGVNTRVGTTLLAVSWQPGDHPLPGRRVLRGTPTTR